MKRYLLFAGDLHYPDGGWNDFRESFDTFEAAAAWFNNIHIAKYWDWGHIVDTETLSVTNMF